MRSDLSLSIKLLTYRGEVSVNVEINGWVIGVILSKILVKPYFDLSLVVDGDHFLSNLEVSMPYIKIVESHQTLKKYIKTLLIR